MDTERLLLFLEDKISDADLDQVRDMLSDDVDTKFVGDAMPFGTLSSTVIRQLGKINAAKDVVRRHVPGMAMDGLETEDAVFRRALHTLGHDVGTLPAGAAKALWPVLHGERTRQKPMSAAETADLRQRFPHAFGLKVR